MTLLVAAVIVHDRANDHVLLLQRGPNSPFGQGCWDLPIGKSEPGEPVTTTATRELHEETALSVRPEDLTVAHVIHGAHGVAAPAGFLTVVFTAHTWTGEPHNREPHKHTRLAWFPTDALPEPFVPSASAALRAHLTGEPAPGLTLHGWQGTAGAGQ